MLRLYRRRFCKRPSVIKRLLLLSVAFLILSTAVFECMVKNVQNNLIENRALIIAEQSVNRAVSGFIAENSEECNNFINIVYNQSGEVRAVTTNSAAINSFKSQIDLIIQEELKKIHVAGVKVPLGAFTGINLFSTVGPQIDFTYYLTASFNSTLSSFFESGGINQTVHHIELKLDAVFTLTCLGHDEQIPFTTNFEIAQTVIAGEVPDTFVNDSF